MADFTCAVKQSVLLNYGATMRPMFYPYWVLRATHGRGLREYLTVHPKRNKCKTSIPEKALAFTSKPPAIIHNGSWYKPVKRIMG